MTMEAPTSLILWQGLRELLGTLGTAGLRRRQVLSLQAPGENQGPGAFQVAKNYGMFIHQ